MTQQYAGDFDYRICPAHGYYPHFAPMCPTCQTTPINLPMPHFEPTLVLVAEKLTERAKIPTKAHKGDLGYDLYSLDPQVIQPGEIRRITTGIRIMFPDGWGAKIFDRSSTATQKGLIVVAGVIDCGYRGEIQIALYNTSKMSLVHIAPGEKIAQMVPMKATEWDIIEGVVDTEETTRGEGGFGSTNA